MGRLYKTILLTTLFMVILIMLAAVACLIFMRPANIGTTAFMAYAPPEESGDWELHFCPAENCMAFLDDAISQANVTQCAFYSLNLRNTTELLLEKDARVFIDEDNAPSTYDKAIPVKQDGLMHHKFCVLDTGVVTTGSFNPTSEGNYKDNNNLFMIHSSYLAKNYAVELESLSGKNVKTPFPRIIHDGFLIENYFCPRDNCESHVLDALRKTNSSVQFMIYTFTSNPIEQELIKLHASGILVEGVIEKFQSANKETYKILNSGGIYVKWDGNPKLMHHKVFIIDNSTVIFGSFNPTAAATKVNRENILIIHNAEIAGKFLEEYARVKNSVIN